MPLDQHPVLNLSPEEREAQLRELLGLPDGMPVPAHINSMVDDLASRKVSDTQRMMEMANIGDRLHNSGVKPADNAPLKYVRDIGVREYNRASIEDIAPAQGFWTGDVPDMWNTAGTQLKRAGLNIARNFLDSVEAYDEFYAEKFGIHILREIAELGTEGEMNPAYELDRATKAWFDSAEDKMQVADEWYKGLIAQREREMMGQVGGWRTTGRVLNEVASGLAPFVVAGVASTLTTGTPTAGIVALTAGYANTIGRDVYEQTGSVEQGVLAGTLNFVTTNALFKAAHVFGRQMNVGLKQMFGKKLTGDLAKHAEKLKLGDISGLMNVIKGAAKIELSAIALRDIEWALNATYQEYFAGDRLAEQYQLTWENFLATTGHAAEEGLLFILFPTVQEGATGIFTRGRNLHTRSLETQKNAYRDLTAKLDSATPAEKAKIIADLEKTKPAGENPLIDYVLGRSGKGAEADSAGFLEAFNKADRKQQKKWNEECAEWIENTVPKDATSVKPLEDVKPREETPVDMGLGDSTRFEYKEKPGEEGRPWAEGFDQQLAEGSVPLSINSFAIIAQKLFNLGDGWRTKEAGIIHKKIQARKKGEKVDLLDALYEKFKDMSKEEIATEMRLMAERGNLGEFKQIGRQMFARYIESRKLGDWEHTVVSLKLEPVNPTGRFSSRPTEAEARPTEAKPGEKPTEPRPETEKPRVIEAEERILDSERAAEESVRKDLERERKEKEGEEGEVELTPEESKRIAEKEKEVDPLAEANMAVHDVSGEHLTKLRSRIEELRKDGAESTAENVRVAESLELAVRTAEIMIENMTGIRPKAGPLPSPRVTKVGKNEYDNPAAEKLLRGRKKETQAERDALAEQLRKDNPEWAEKTNVQIANILKKEYVESRAEIKREPGMTPAERKEAMALREQIASENTLGRAKRQALTIVKKTARTAKQIQNRMRLADKKKAGALRKTWNEFINKVEAELKELGVDAKVLKRIDKIKRRADKYTNKKIENEGKLEVEIDKVTREIQGILETSASKRVKKLLSQRKESIHTRLSGRLDSVVSSIKKLFDPSWKEGGDWRPALKKHFEIREREGLTPEEARGLEFEMTEILTKVEREGKDSLTFEQSTKLANFLENLYDQSHSGWEAVQASRRAEVELVSEATTREILKTEGLIDETGYSRVDGMSSHVQGFVDFVKAVGHGIHANGRIQEAVEYMTGGNNTVGYKYLVTDVLQGFADARLGEAKLHAGLRALFEKRLGKGFMDILKSVSESQRRNNPGSKNKPNKKFEPAITIKDSKGKEIQLSQGEVVGVLMQAMDSSTYSLWKDGNAGLRLRGRDRAIDTENGKIIDQIREQAKGTNAEKVANVLVEFINSELPTRMVREMGFRLKGVDIIGWREIGDFFVPRVRRLKGDKGDRFRERDPNSLNDAMEHEAGLDLGGPRFDKKHTAERTTESTHDVVVGDGQFTINAWFRAITNLRYAEESLTRAQNILGSEGLANIAKANRNAKGAAGLTSKILTNMNKHFYEPTLKAERGFVENRNAIDSWARVVRNNLVKAGLAFNPAIPVYQALSLIAASGHMGRGGKRAIIQAMFEMATNPEHSYSKVWDRGTANSGWLFDRVMTGNAMSLATGEISQSFQSRVVLGGQKVAGTARGGVGAAWEKTTNAGMRPIEFVDNVAVVALYRATEIHLEAKWAARGKKRTPENEAVFQEWVRREYEANLIETQPSFHPMHQPALINTARKDTYVSFYTMFKGYTGKLVAMQRRAFMRANRARREGNMKALAHHLSYGAKMTVYGSALIPLIRTFVKESISQGGAEMLEFLGITDEQNRELGDFALTVEEKARDQYLYGQVLGMTGVGSMLEESIGWLRGGTYMGGTTPYNSTITQMWRATEALLSTNRDAPFMTQVKRWMAVMRPALGVGTGMPQQVFNIPRGVIREIEETHAEIAARNSRRLYGR